MPLAHTAQGKGPPLLLVHGFPMNGSVWSAFAKLLATHFETYTIDLPGFGESATTPAPVSIDDVARHVNDWVRQHRLQQAVLVGHSLGGYVVLAMADLEPDWYKGLVLFHSTALPDSEEKKQSRNKVIEFVRRNGAESFTGSFIDPLFADRKHAAIELVRQINLQTSADAVINYTIAMRDRPDRTHVLKQSRNPVLLIGGDKDPGIAPASLHAQARLAGNVRTAILANTGHMGMFEQPSEAASLITEFATGASAPDR